MILFETWEMTELQRWFYDRADEVIAEGIDHIMVEVEGYWLEIYDDGKIITHGMY